MVDSGEGSATKTITTIPEKILDCRSSSLSSENQSVLTQILEEEIEQLRQNRSQLEKERDRAAESLKMCQKQQRQLCESFQLLRDKYDDLKSENHFTLWEYIPAHIGGGKEFSELAVVNNSVFETSDRIGDYGIGSLLGEGHFADVRLCIHTPTSKEYAIKVMRKNKVVSVNGLQRIQREISVLRKVNHSNIVKVVNVINSPKCVYVMTELGGKDLFSFFDANTEGVENNVVREIVFGIAWPLFYLHTNGICHRDLKPENILLSQCDGDAPISYENIQICDFGNCAEHLKPGVQSLSDLCGSPGFFAPEMILGGDCYDGIAADIWSLGCIMLELTRGQDEFCKTWLVSYDYNTLQDEKAFECAINTAVKNIKTADDGMNIVSSTNTSGTMWTFLSKLLMVEPSERLESRVVLSHPWLSEKASSCNIKPPELISPSQHDFCESPRISAHNPKVPNLSKRRKFRNSMSSRARKHFTGSAGVVFNDSINSQGTPVRQKAGTTQHLEICLPPIEPKTPSSIKRCV
mmetsp:Transcript_55461/g.82178  ORF Transcript_55461/g.82178 Transcript_55461/m.82178 type:complete len:521 (+) Transcript_55461:167-1729(+)|eukprot:CAMPEP_0195514936 /NCGR_PEP_ID=MMETSP0794_2-20130614/6172_1 /TAXON_ID=515487 /ORGANISM="Stephanopyxis turris, Strain CCMP 815" /LENGTH=520 /DNA_ID=CAMNT_0040643291 /DNA_START=156 /DNA_END=1718 /DNA_ORIENTATION=+